jgi:hypothetical protein
MSGLQTRSMHCCRIAERKTAVTAAARAAVIECGNGGLCIRCPDNFDTCDLRSAAMELDATRYQTLNNEDPYHAAADPLLDSLIRSCSTSESPCAGCRLHAGAVPYLKTLPRLDTKSSTVSGRRYWIENIIEDNRCLVWETVHGQHILASTAQNKSLTCTTFRPTCPPTG